MIKFDQDQKCSKHNNFIQKCNFCILFIPLGYIKHGLQYFYQAYEFLSDIPFLVPWSVKHLYKKGISTLKKVLQEISHNAREILLHNHPQPPEPSYIGNYHILLGHPWENLNKQTIVRFRNYFQPLPQ